MRFPIWRASLGAVLLLTGLISGLAPRVCAQGTSGGEVVAARPASLLFVENRPSTVRAETGLAGLPFSTRLVSAQRAADRWFAPDKAKHLGASVLLTLSGQYVLTQKFSLSERSALPLSVAGAALAGVAKEVYDWKVKPPYYFSRRDLLADALGIALGAGLILL